MSASETESPGAAPQGNEDVGARISRLEEYVQQNTETMRRQADLVASLNGLSQSILQRLGTPLPTSAGGDEQLAAMRELAPMTLERQSGGGRGRRAAGPRRRDGLGRSAGGRPGTATRRPPERAGNGGPRVPHVPPLFS